MHTKLAVCLFAAAVMASAVEQTETIRQSYPYASKLDVRNVNGRVNVTGYNGNEIQLIVEKKINAKTAEAMDLAKREVRLDVRPTGSSLRVCIESPYNNCEDNGGNRGCRNDCERDYSVSFNMELQVPMAIAVDLKTVNGSVKASKINGNFNAKTVNGSVTLEEMGGTGDAHTVNGGVKIAFTTVPSQPIQAKTVNGKIEISMPRNANGTFHVNTLHGDIFTNIPAANVTTQPTVEARNGGHSYRIDKKMILKVGGGGPDHQFSTVNGSIEIAER